MKSYLIFNTTNKLIAGRDLEDAFKQYSELEIDSNLKESIKNRIYLEKNFQISISELHIINNAIEKRIDKLLKDENFNPFKEELRKIFPNQYGSQPYEFNKKVYYLYPKGFEIDNLINTNINLKKLVEEHILANKPLIYVYKE